MNGKIRTPPENRIIAGGGAFDQRHYEDHPELGTGLISYEHAISPRSFELEREAIFRRSWINVGHELRLPKVGSYFTRELEVLKTSIIVVRGKDRKIRAFHNVCPHRGNKLVWDGHPAQETSGRAMAFFCKYHGLGYALDGKIEVLRDPDNWFGSQGCDLHLAEVPVELWNGYIFANFRPGGPSESLRAYMGEHIWSALDDIPIDLYTDHVRGQGEIDSNWKTLHDAFSEAWHGSVLHSQAMVTMRNITFRAPPSRFDGPHRTAIACGTVPEGAYTFDIERISRASVTGSQVRPAHEIDAPKAAFGPDQQDWVAVTFTVFPNFQLQIYAPGWINTYNYWPLAHNRMRFEINQYFQRARNFSELFARTTGIALVLDNVLQDLGLLEATQRGLESRVYDAYPLIDEEHNIRHFHKMVDDRIRAYRQELGEDV